MLKPNQKSSGQPCQRWHGCRVLVPTSPHAFNVFQSASVTLQKETTSKLTEEYFTLKARGWVAQYLYSFFFISLARCSNRCYKTRRPPRMVEHPKAAYHPELLSQDDSLGKVSSKSIQDVVCQGGVCINTTDNHPNETDKTHILRLSCQPRLQSANRSHQEAQPTKLVPRPEKYVADTNYDELRSSERLSRILHRQRRQTARRRCWAWLGHTRSGQGHQRLAQVQLGLSPRYQSPPGQSCPGGPLYS